MACRGSGVQIPLAPLKCEPIRERGDWYLCSRKPTICPNCGKKEVKKAVFGYPTEEDKIVQLDQEVDKLFINFS